MEGGAPVRTSHYIVLMQSGDNPASRIFSDYDSLFACMEGITGVYDDFLKNMYPNEPDVVYDMCTLASFVANLKDIACLVHCKKHNMYKAQGKDWIIEQLYKHLLKSKDN